MRKTRPQGSKSRSFSRARFSRRQLYVALVAASQLTLSPLVAAGPAGGKVMGGEGVIDQVAENTTIRQGSDRLAINWDSFDVDSGQSVTFIQPDSSAIALNRILGNNGSEIHGRIDANGHVVLVNPHGVLFGKGAELNVGGLVASGLDINPDDFMKGSLNFAALEGTEGKVINSGIIQAATGGSVTLLGQQVRNDGLIMANLGAVNLAAGKEAVLTFDGSGLMGVKITREVLQEELGVDAAVLNNGDIQAAGGRILLTASVSQDIFSQAVNTGELEQAKSVVVHEDGSFTLGAGADVVNTGTLDVSASGSADAGEVVVLGENVTSSGAIRADATERRAGSIELHARDTALLTEQGVASARAEANHSGGRVKVLGHHVGLFDSAKVDASGAMGGGAVYIGGDYKGENAAMRNAWRTFVADDAAIYVDALEDGDGGRAIVWADDVTRFRGDIYGRGMGSGRGGFAEVSGKNTLSFNGYADLSATNGAGTLLLDPRDIQITYDGADDYDNNNQFGEGSGDAAIRASLIENELNQGTAVLLEATRNVSILHNIRADAGSMGSLAINAGNAINIGAGVTLGSGNMTFTAGHISCGAAECMATAGSRSVNVTEPLKTAGNITIYAADGVEINRQIGTTETNAITIRAGNAVNVNQSITAGKISISAGDDTLHSEGLTAAPASDAIGTLAVANTITTTGDGLWLSAKGGITLGGNIDVQNTGTFSAISRSGGINQTAGNVSVAGDTTLEAKGVIKLAQSGNSLDGVIRLTTHGVASAVELRNATDTHIGNSSIKGTLDITSAGKILDFGAVENQNDNVGLETIVVGGKTTLNSHGNVIDLGNRNHDFSTFADISVVGKDVAIRDVNSLTVGRIETIGGEGMKGGDISLNAGGSLTTGALVANGGAAENNRSGNDGGSIRLTANESLEVGELATSGSSADHDPGWGYRGFGGTGGNIELNARSGTVSVQTVETNGGNGTAPSDSGSTNGNAGKIALTGSEITLNKSLWARGGTRSNGTDARGGDISLNGRLKLADDVQIRADSQGTGPRGNVTVNGAVTSTGNSNYDLTVNGNNITFEGDLGTAAEALGNITLYGTGDIAARSTNADTGETKLHNLFGHSLDATGTTSSNFVVGDITTAGAGTAGGHVSISTQGTLTTGAIDTRGGAATTSGHAGGNVTLAGRDITVGRVTTQGSAGSGADAEGVAYAAGEGGDLSITAQHASEPTAITLLGDINTQAGDAAATNGTAQLTLANAGSVTFSHAGPFSSNVQVTGSSSDADTLQGPNRNSDWAIDQDFGGFIKGRNAQATEGTITFTGFENLVGGRGDDTFAFTGATGTANAGHVNSIDGGGGQNTLQGRNTGTTWVIQSGTKSLSENGVAYVSDFANIQILQGGGGVDTFHLDTVFDGDIRGGAGADIFNVGISGSAHSLLGEADSDMLTGPNEDALWTLGGTNGTLAWGEGSSARHLGFSSMEIVNGGTEDDVFEVDGLWRGEIDGGDGANILAAREGHPIRGRNEWTITDTDAGNLNSNNVIFSNIKHLIGSAQEDTFDIADGGTITGLIDGGSAAPGQTGYDQLIIQSAHTVQVGREVNENLNITGIEHIEDTQSQSTLFVATGDNTWTISAENQGTVAAANDSDSTGTESLLDGSVTFKGFVQLKGGTGDDRFSFEGGTLTGGIEGGEGTNTLAAASGANAWLLDDANSGTFNGLSFSEIHHLEGGSGSDSLTGYNQNNRWTLTGAGEGSVSADVQAPTDRVVFSGMDNLTGGAQEDVFAITGGSLSGALHGGDGKDTFNLSSDASIAGGIKGGKGDDTLNLVVHAGASGQVAFDGGEGENTTTVTGGGAGYSAEHTATPSAGGQLNYADAANNRYSLTYTGVSHLDDQLQADLLTLTGTALDDEFAFGNGAYNLNNSLNIAYSGKESLLIAASASDSVAITGPVAVNQRFTIQNAAVTGAGSITAADLHLDKVRRVGRENQRLSINADQLWLNQAAGPVYLNELNNLTLAQFSSSGKVDIALAGDLTSRVDLLFAQDFYAASSAGSVDLSRAGNLLSGKLHLSAADTITLANNGRTQLGSIQARNLNLTSTGVVMGEGPLVVSEEAVFSAGGALTLNNDNNRLNSVTITKADNVDLRTAGELTLRRVNAKGNVSTQSDSLSVVGAITAASLNAVAKQGPAMLSGDLNIALDAKVAAEGITLNNGIVASAIALDGGAGDVNLFGSLDTTNGSTVHVKGRHIEQRASIHSGKETSITASGDFLQSANIFSGSGLTINAGGAIAVTQGAATQGGQIAYTAAGDIQLQQISASRGLTVESTTGTVRQNARLEAVEDIAITAAGDFLQGANLVSGGELAVEAGGKLQMAEGTATQGSQIAYTAAGDIQLQQLSASRGLAVESASGTVRQSGHLQAVEDITLNAGAYVMNQGARLTSTTSAIAIASKRDAETRQIEARGPVNIESGGSLHSRDSIASSHDQLSLIASGDITSEGALTSASGLALHSRSGNIDQRGRIHTTAGDVEATAARNLTMGGSASTTSDAGNITYTAGRDLTVTDLVAEGSLTEGMAEGTLKLTAEAGQIAQVSPTQSLVANRLEINAHSSVGADQALNLQVKELALNNQSGNARITNSGTLTVDHFRNNGNIHITNNNGDLILNSAIGQPFLPNEGDANLAGGTANANYNLGSITLHVSQGSILATGPVNAAQPDIVAKNASLIAPLGDIGSPSRPLVLYVQDSAFIQGFRSWPSVWGLNIPPKDPQDASSIQVNLLDLLNAGSEQMVEVESLEDIDPAIFADVRNFFYNEVSILLPEDQQYDEY